MDIIKVSEGIKSKEIPVARRTLGRWYRAKQYPGLIIKIGGCLFWNRDEWIKIISEKCSGTTT